MSSSTNFYSFLSYISSAFAFFPFCIALFSKNYLSKELKILWLLLTFSIVTDITGYILTFVFNLSNIQLLNTYIILETLLISTFYLFVISNKIWKNLILTFIILFTTYSIIQFISKNNKMLDNVILTTESITVTLLSIVTFYHLLEKQIYSNILSVPIFWINSSFLFYFSGNLFLHLFSQYLQKHALYTFYELWGLWHSLLNIIFYTLISIGFWKTKTSQI